MMMRGKGPTEIRQYKINLRIHWMLSTFKTIIYVRTKGKGRSTFLDPLEKKNTIKKQRQKKKVGRIRF